MAAAEEEKRAEQRRKREELLKGLMKENTELHQKMPEAKRARLGAEDRARKAEKALAAV